MNFLFGLRRKSKVVTALLCLFLLFSHAELYAQSSMLKSSIEDFSIPQSMGSVETYHQGHGKKIFYIQDAHDSLDAQLSIVNIIHHLVEHEGVKTVFEEGYEGLVPTEAYFGHINDSEIKEKVSYFLMDKLRIGGAEYAHINRSKDFKLIGVDDNHLQLENIRAFQNVMKHQKETETQILMLQEILQTRINQEFPEVMKTWLKKQKKYQQKKLPLRNYLQQTLDFAPKTLELQNFPEIQKMIEVDLQRKAHEEVNIPEFLEEMRQLEESLVDFYLKTKAQKQAFRFFNELEILRRLNRLQLSNDEYKHSRNFIESMNTETLLSFIYAYDKTPRVTSRLWEIRIRQAMVFYDLAEQRDLAIKKNLESFIKGDEEQAVLVFGGFHRERIQTILKTLGFSYDVITPKMEHFDLRHQKYYRQLMSRGQHVFEIPFHVARAVRAISIHQWQPSTASEMIDLLAEGVRIFPLNFDVGDQRFALRKFLERYAVVNRNELRMTKSDLGELRKVLQTIAESNATPLKLSHVDSLIKDIESKKLSLSRKSVDIVTADEEGEETILGTLSRSLSNMIFFPDGTYQRKATQDMKGEGKQLPHRVSKVLIQSPDTQEIIVMSDVGKKSVRKTFKLFGGHVESRFENAESLYAPYDHAASSEVAEELEFDVYFGKDYQPQGQFERIGKYGAFESQPEWKNHRISLYLYTPTDDEMKAIKKYQKYLERQRKSLGKDAFFRWLQKNKKKKSNGKGEVSRVLTLPTEDLLDLEKMKSQKAEATLLHLLGEDVVRDRLIKLVSDSKKEEGGSTSVRNEMRIDEENVRAVFEKIQQALDGLPTDFKMKYRVSYELMSVEATEKDLASLREGRDGDLIFKAVMQTFKQRGLMLGVAFDERAKGDDKDTYHTTLRINSDYASLSAHDIVEYVEAQVNAREDVEDLRDTERAVQAIREHFLGEEAIETQDFEEILELGDLRIWRQLKLDLKTLSLYGDRSELRSDEEKQTQISLGDEEAFEAPLKAKPETIDELLEALNDDEMMFWAAEKLDDQNLDEKIKVRALKILFHGRSIPEQLKTASLANIAYRIILLRKPHVAYFFGGIPDIAFNPDLLELLPETIMQRVRDIKQSEILNISNPEEHPILLRRPIEVLEAEALEIDRLVRDEGLQVSYKAGPNIRKVEVKILFLNVKTLADNLKLLQRRDIDHVSYEALLVASTEKLETNLELLIDTYGFSPLDAAQVAANATQTLILNHAILTALQIPVTTRRMKRSSIHLIQRIRAGKIKPTIASQHAERILKEFETLAENIRRPFNDRSELRRYQNQVDALLIGFKEDMKQKTMPKLYRAMKTLEGRYVVSVDVKDFRQFSKEQRREFYKLFPLFEEKEKVVFVFYRQKNEPYDELLSELVDFSADFKNVKMIENFSEINFQHRKILNFSKKGFQSMSGVRLREGLQDLKDYFEITYGKSDKEGLLLAALLLLESGQESMIRHQSELQNFAEQLNSEIQELLTAFQYIGQSA